MELVRTLAHLLLAALGALAGSLVGGRLRALARGEASPPAYSLTHDGPDGETIVAINPVFTNLVPGLLAALLGRPRWLWSFLAACMAGYALGDSLEGQLMALLNPQPPPLLVGSPPPDPAD